MSKKLEDFLRGVKRVNNLETLDDLKTLIEIETEICEFEKFTSAGTKKFDNFLRWLKENNVDGLQNLTIDSGFEEGNGLRAIKDIEEGKLIAKIPRKIMMTSEDAVKTNLKPWLSQDQMVKTNPSIALTLFLIQELRNPKSFWKHYVDILPRTFSIPLFYTFDQCCELKGSPALDEVIKYRFTIIKQYLYCSRLFTLNKSNLTLREFKWAVGAVMTRQNNIKNMDGTGHDLALIPLWDMGNHCDGKITTFFENGSTEFYSQSNFKKGDQIYFFYGPRNNFHLLLYSGFFYDKNVYDSVRVKVIITNEQYDLKLGLLKKFSIPLYPYYDLYDGPIEKSADLLSVLRVITLNDFTTFNSLMDGKITRDEKGKISDQNEKDALRNLEILLKIQLRTYPTTLEEDEAILSQNSKDFHSTLCIKLRMSEKRIIRNALLNIEEISKTL